MKRLSLWAERKWERYNFGPDFPPVMFWSLTALFLIQCVLVVQVIVEYHALLQASILRRAAMVLLLYPLTWIAYYRLHKRLRRLLEESPPPNQRFMREVVVLLIALVLGVNMLFVVYLSILRRLLERVYH